MKIKTEAIESHASFSPCRQWRYTLERRFAFGEGIINFIMLNPSTADEDHNDPTVGRCEKIALSRNYNGMIITNLYAYRATDPREMMRAHAGGADVIGAENDCAIINSASRSKQVICAWGNHGVLAGRSKQVKEMLTPMHAKLHYLVMNKSGEPKHPLYVAAGCEPIQWVLTNAK